MLFSQPLQLDVPVLPRVRKFLRANYPTGILVNPSDHRLFQLWAIAQTEKVKVRTRQIPEDLSVIVSIRISQTHGSRRQSMLNVVEMRMFNKMIDLLIYQEFFSLVKANRLKATTRNWLAESIRAFTDKYDFSDEDLAEATLKMAYMRHQSEGRLGFDDTHLLSPFELLADLPSGLLPSLMMA
jgi:hypothetical protein